MPDPLFSEVHTPWLRSFICSLRDAVHPAKLPPLEVTSKPVAVRDIWGGYRYGKRAGLSSILIHASVAVLIFAAGSSKPVQEALREQGILIAPADLADYLPSTHRGGGGGGGRSPLPPSKGQAPRFAPRQLVPPSTAARADVALPVQPTLVGPADMQAPRVKLPNWGDPWANIGPPSDGPGSDGGIGTGKRGGIGPNEGPGAGNGPGVGCCSGVFQLGSIGVSRPVPIYKVEPEYSEEARKAKFQGVVVLSIVIDERGNPTHIKIVRMLGMGLDEKAVQAVSQWRFRPGMKDGKPVAVQAEVEVTFRLL
jgi:protein TonB